MGKLHTVTSFLTSLCMVLGYGNDDKGLEIKTVSQIAGSDPTFWMSKATEMFDDSFCSPAKGGGEVAYAFYLYFQKNHMICY